MFPSLPTDNLYKFIFVAGLFLTIWGVYLHEETNKQFLRESIDIRVFQGKMSIGQQSLNDIDTLNLKNISYTEIQALRDKLKTYVDSTRSFIGNREYKHATLMSDLNHAWISLIAGLILMIVGGILWYLRVQRYQDLVLRYEVAKAVNDISHLPQMNTNWRFTFIAAAIISIVFNVLMMYIERSFFS